MKPARKVTRRFRSRIGYVNKGFTLVELMIVMVIVAVGVALATPTFKSIIEKRQLTSAAEEVTSFLTFAQGEAIKANDEVTVSWYSPGGHNSNWCVGATEGAAACDCRETITTAADFCDIDDQPYRLTQTDFVGMNFEFMHMRKNVGSFSFDPVRGTMINNTSDDFLNDYLFYLHSNEGSGSSREYELEVRIKVTGRVFVCTDTSRKRIIGGYTTC